MKIDWNKKYTTIAIYALLVILTGTLLVLLSVEALGVVKDGTLTGFLKIFNPFVYGFAIAYFLNPIMIMSEKYIFGWVDKKKPRKKLKRVLSLILTMLFGLAIISSLLLVVIPQLLASIDQLWGKIVDLINKYAKDSSLLMDTLNDFLERFNLSSDFEKQMTTYLAELIGKGMTLLSESVTPIITYLIGILSSLVTQMANIFVGIIISVYFLSDKEKFAAQLKKILFSFLKRERAESFIALMRTTHKTVGSFITGVLLDSLLVGFITFVFMSVFRMNYAVLIAVIVGITNMIPFFGPFIGAIPSVLILLMSQPIQALIFIIYVIVMQQVDGNIINPRIIGHNIGISPFWVIFAIIIMSGLFGAAGIFVGVPLFSVLYTLVSRYISSRLKKRSLPEATEDYYASDIPLSMAMPEKKDGKTSETSDKR